MFFLLLNMLFLKCSSILLWHAKEAYFKTNKAFLKKMYIRLLEKSQKISQIVSFMSGLICLNIWDFQMPKFSMYSSHWYLGYHAFSMLEYVMIVLIFLRFSIWYKLLLCRFIIYSAQVIFKMDRIIMVLKLPNVRLLFCPFFGTSVSMSVSVKVFGIKSGNIGNNCQFCLGYNIGIFLVVTAI